MTHAELIDALAALPFEEQAEVFRRIVGFQIACCRGCGCYPGAPWCHPVTDIVAWQADGECASQCLADAELAAYEAAVDADEADEARRVYAAREAEAVDEARRVEADAADVWREYYGPRERPVYDWTDDGDEPPF